MAFPPFPDFESGGGKFKSSAKSDVFLVGRRKKANVNRALAFEALGRRRDELLWPPRARQIKAHFSALCVHSEEMELID